MAALNTTIQSSVSQLKREMQSLQIAADDANTQGLFQRLLSIAEQAIDLRNQVGIAYYGEDHSVHYTVAPTS